MILVRNLSLGLGENESLLRLKAAKKLGTAAENIKNLRIVRKSLDARKKTNIKWLYSVAVELESGEKRILGRKSGDISEYLPFSYEISPVESEERPVVIGFGPAGMFAALVLAKAGLRPIVFERGCDVETRTEKVRRFWETGELDPECNVQFGEGGAGTFSDGKLNTGTHDRRISWVLGELHRHGAPENICYDAKPHIGTDILRVVVKNLRETVIDLGGDIRFGAKLAGIKTDDRAITHIEIETEGKKEFFPCSNVILATGHSARDTFEMLCENGVPMQPKPFSMGVRIEHRQSDIGFAQYGEAYEKLPAADYKLNCRFDDGESAYTFCMCPGGQVVASASENGGVVTNGMSLSARDGENANSALLVTLRPEDFPPNGGVLAGMYWQRDIEKACYSYGGGNYLAPAQRVEDFLHGRPSEGAKSVVPSYKPGVVWGDLREVLPDKICSTLKRAIPELDKKLKGFAAADAVLTAPETRSSSPVRILRGDDLSSSVRGLYPCGEGAGYAGGITSAAVDGIRCAEAVIEKIKEHL